MFFYIYLELQVTRRAKSENFGSKTLNKKIVFFMKFAFSATEFCQTYLFFVDVFSRTDTNGSMLKFKEKQIKHISSTERLSNI